MVVDLEDKKQMRPIDYLPDEPLDALSELWVEMDPGPFITMELPHLFCMALSHDGTEYNNKVRVRAKFIEFYVDLLPFLEAIVCYEVQMSYYKDHKSFPDCIKMQETLKKSHGGIFECLYLDKKRAVESKAVIVKFCQKYPIEYSRREVFDFIEAAQYYSGPLTGDISGLDLWQDYVALSTLLEVGFVLAKS